MEETDLTANNENILKVLVATDIHLGYGEKHPVRDRDSFVAFEEILQLGVKHEVDFILLGGDLFHDSKPSPYCMNKCLELLRKYCLGDKPVSIEFLSDQSYHFQHLVNPIVNYEDSNLNIAIPVFSIHGNHDDPTGQKQISAMDVIASTGLINYFGRCNDFSRVEIRPILLQKGETKLALYGLSHIRDERLGRLFRNKKVIMAKPAEDTGKWFNLMVLHQNRVERGGSKNFIPYSVIPDFVDLVIWGHEHDCRIEPEEQPNGVFISQPGSSVCTSLAEGESITKKVGLLEIQGSRFKMTPITLTTVRPFLFDDLILENPNSENYNCKSPSEQAIEQVKSKIDSMIAEANRDKGISPPPLPLIRLTVRYHEERQQFNVIRLGQQFADRIANPEDVLVLKSLKVKHRNRGINFMQDESDFENIQEWATKVEDLVEKYFEDDPKLKHLDVLSVKGLTYAVTNFINKGDSDAIKDVMEDQMKKTLARLKEIDPDLDSIDDCLEGLRMEREQQADKQIEEAAKLLGSSARVLKKANFQDSDDSDATTTLDEEESSTKGKSKMYSMTETRGRGTRRARGSRSRGTTSRKKDEKDYTSLTASFKK